MPKGYWVAHVDVHDPDNYKNYVAANGAAFAKFGGKFLVRAGAFENPVGNSRSRNIIIEFPSYGVARDCWNSQDYQDARAKQKGGAEMDLIIIEGYDGPQPG
jgi:uncharacterized protein (DUF1330 family)